MKPAWRQTGVMKPALSLSGGQTGGGQTGWRQTGIMTPIFIGDEGL